MRKGEYIGTVETAKTNEAELTEMMVGKKVDLHIDRPVTHFDEDMLVLKNVCVNNSNNLRAIDNVSFKVRRGEILGVAGISGSGQKELCEAIAGLEKVKSGSIEFMGQTISGKTPLDIINLGIAMSFIPEDRLGMGLAGTLNIIDNMMLKTYRANKFNPFVDRKKASDMAKGVVEKLDVQTPDTDKTPVRRLSGGNGQKVLLGREIEMTPQVIVTAYPVRGLDINSSYLIYDILNKQKQDGVGILFVGEDLDVMLQLCDKILVLCHGRVTGIVEAAMATKEKLGLMMTGMFASEAFKDTPQAVVEDGQFTEDEEKTHKDSSEISCDIAQKVATPSENIEDGKQSLSSNNDIAEETLLDKQENLKSDKEFSQEENNLSQSADDKTQSKKIEYNADSKTPIEERPEKKSAPKKSAAKSTGSKSSVKNDSKTSAAQNKKTTASASAAKKTASSKPQTEKSSSVSGAKKTSGKTNVAASSTKKTTAKKQTVKKEADND